MGNDCNLLVLDTEFSLEVKSTALLHCMVFIGNEILFVLDFTVFWQLDEKGEFGTLTRFFFGVLVEVGVTSDPFPKSFFGDVEIVFLLHVTICWGVCE